MILEEIDFGPSTTCPYEVGSVLTVWHAAGSLQRSDDKSQVVRVKIKKLQQPWTLSCCMVVDILSDSLDIVRKTAFLKLFDWRFAAQQRSDQGVNPWSEKSAVEYAEFVVGGGAEEFLDQLKASQHEETEEDWDPCQDETFLVHQARTMYNNETTVYSRLQALQGRTVPRLMGAVEIDITPPGMDGDKFGELFKVQGILVEYFPDSFTLRDIGTMVPTEDLQEVVDQAVEIARSLGDYEVLDTDVRLDNFLVTTQRGNADKNDKDLPRQTYRVVMLDFAQSRVRREDESDFDWGRAKVQQDEEGAVGMVIRHHLSKLGKHVSYKPSGRYEEFAEGESEDEQ
ncbi:casein kinase I RAG8 [Cercophora samala]|uniref:Casein kinase I RAG8 n=1 Tax=Cercophora samala TaxID=330535 RepID=A0AA39Z2Y5_9PEZI|nr:casein kinase I RAG8 [Cercophora samala]